MFSSAVLLPSGLSLTRPLCTRYNRDSCQLQDSGHCYRFSIKAQELVLLEHCCSFILPCSGLLCGSRAHTARGHSRWEPAHCWACLNTTVREARLGPRFIILEVQGGTSSSGEGSDVDMVQTPHSVASATAPTPHPGEKFALFEWIRGTVKLDLNR